MCELDVPWHMTDHPCRICTAGYWNQRYLAIPEHWEWFFEKFWRLMCESDVPWHMTDHPCRICTAGYWNQRYLAIPEHWGWFFEKFWRLMCELDVYWHMTDSYCRICTAGYWNQRYLAIPKHWGWLFEKFCWWTFQWWQYGHNDPWLTFWVIVMTKLLLWQMSILDMSAAWVMWVEFSFQSVTQLSVITIKSQWLMIDILGHCVCWDMCPWLFFWAKISGTCFRHFLGHFLKMTIFFGSFVSMRSQWPYDFQKQFELSPQTAWRHFGSFFKACDPCSHKTWGDVPLSSWKNSCFVDELLRQKEWFMLSSFLWKFCAFLCPNFACSDPQNTKKIYLGQSGSVLRGNCGWCCPLWHLWKIWWVNLSIRLVTTQELQTTHSCSFCTCFLEQTSWTSQTTTTLHEPHEVGDDEVAQMMSHDMWQHIMTHSCIHDHVCGIRVWFCWFWLAHPGSFCPAGWKLSTSVHLSHIPKMCHTKIEVPNQFFGIHLSNLSLNGCCSTHGWFFAQLQNHKRSFGPFCVQNEQSKTKVFQDSGLQKHLISWPIGTWWSQSKKNDWKKWVTSASKSGFWGHFWESKGHFLKISNCDHLQWPNSFGSWIFFSFMSQWSQWPITHENWLGTSAWLGGTLLQGHFWPQWPSQTQAPRYFTHKNLLAFWFWW